MKKLLLGSLGALITGFVATIVAGVTGNKKEEKGEKK